MLSDMIPWATYVMPNGQSYVFRFELGDVRGVKISLWDERDCIPKACLKFRLYGTFGPDHEWHPSIPEMLLETLESAIVSGWDPDFNILWVDKCRSTQSPAGSIEDILRQSDGPPGRYFIKTESPAPWTWDETPQIMEETRDVILVWEPICDERNYHKIA